ncbi:MAG: YHS domain-containing (seleno)protein [Cyanobacteria bacterium P01_D01_bin.14]
MMRIQYLGQVAMVHRTGLAIATCLLLSAGCSADIARDNESDGSPAAAVSTAAPSAQIEADAEPCAAADPCAAAQTVAEADVQPKEISNLRYFTDGSGVAIRGTDPVAYFTEGAAVAGRPDFAYTWGNATWQFASAENRAAFVANPERYAPEYGGFCAWAVSQGYTASIDPNAWRIVDGRLYLNYSRGVQRQWEQDIPGNISKANENWPGVLGES